MKCMNPPTEQLIRDYLNRLAVAARGQLGFAQRQSLLDRTRARIDAECAGACGASAVQVRKALAGLGDPIALVELELSEAGRKSSEVGERHDPGVTGNGYEMAADKVRSPGVGPASGIVEMSEIGRDSRGTGGPKGSEDPRPRPPRTSVGPPESLARQC